MRPQHVHRLQALTPEARHREKLKAKKITPGTKKQDPPSPAGCRRGR
jgi:hypothetical protein